MNHHANYLPQGSFTSKVIVRTETQTNRHTHTHTHTADGLLFKVHRHKALGNEMRIRSLSVESKYTVSQKTSHLWLAITFTDVNRLLIILAKILPIKQGIKRHFTIPAQISCASVLSGKTGNTKMAFFPRCRPISALPEFNQLLLDFFSLFDSRLILTLLYDSLNFVINGIIVLPVIILPLAAI